MDGIFMKRILVLGSGGAGKTTFSKSLSEKTGLPVIHLDSFFWNPGWVETGRVEWRQMVTDMCLRSEWIMDGNYSGTLDIRLKYADTVIFLDFSRTACILGALKRLAAHIGRVREEMPAGCAERFDTQFLNWIWRFPRSSRPAILELLDKASPETSLFVVKNRSSLQKLLLELKRN